MSSPELPNSPEGGNGWAVIDPIEQAERVERHLEMARDMLAITEDGEDTSVKISFGRYMEEGNLFTYAPGEHMGVLLGIEEGDEPALIIGKYEVFLVEVDPETDEITNELLIDYLDVARVPIREIGDFWGATATPETWGFLEGRQS